MCASECRRGIVFMNELCIFYFRHFRVSHIESDAILFARVLRFV